ncbi:unnamed protein product [Psylliodes chrysocephalus]|uniref:CCHC-type domain-containing protein n=1 Tax=Psylliodes chrysocephalus TaxID=3402493 RepID=A0A9P0CZH5_9CUCU|nr:unnamed protein product [Psylliodes chrysocephala]
MDRREEVENYIKNNLWRGHPDRKNKCTNIRNGHTNITYRYRVLGERYSELYYTYKEIDHLEWDTLQMDKGIFRSYAEKYQELLELQGNYETMEVSTTIRTKNGQKITTQKVHKVETDGTEVDLWKTLQQIRDSTKEDQKVAIHEMEGVALVNLRKMAEVIFHGSDTQVKIYHEGNINNIKKERPRYGLLINSDNKSYKDILADVKNAVKGSGDMDKIRTIRSTKEGKLLITLDKDEQAMVNIKKALREKTELKIRQIGKDEMEVIHIRGMDLVTTAEEMQEAITNRLGEWNAENRIGNIRPLANNTIAATVSVRKEDADILLRNKFIKIGLVRGRMEKSLKVERCTRCWSFDYHNRDTCDGPDRHDLCFKCGEKDHASSTCNNEAKCPVCPVEENQHKFGTIKCAEFKRALNKARNKEKKLNRQG